VYSSGQSEHTIKSIAVESQWPGIPVLMRMSIKAEVAKTRKGARLSRRRVSLETLKLLQ